MPSAKLTVDEFREIWFQNASDPPSFAKPQAAIEQSTLEAEEEGLLLPAAQEAEAQSAFLEEMVADRALEDEINRHLDNDEFQQALAEMNGTYCPLVHVTKSQPYGRNTSLKNNTPTTVISRI